MPTIKNKVIKVKPWKCMKHILLQKKFYLKWMELKKLNSKNSAFVSIEFRVDRNNESSPILYKQYTQVVDSNESSMASTINAFGIAVNSIYQSFYNDLRKTLVLQ